MISYNNKISLQAFWHFTLLIKYIYLQKIKRAFFESIEY